MKKMFQWQRLWFVWTLLGMWTQMKNKTKLNIQSHWSIWETKDTLFKQWQYISSSTNTLSSETNWWKGRKNVFICMPPFSFQFLCLTRTKSTIYIIRLHVQSCDFHCHKIWFVLTKYKGFSWTLVRTWSSTNLFLRIWFKLNFLRRASIKVFADIYIYDGTHWNSVPVDWEFKLKSFICWEKLDCENICKCGVVTNTWAVDDVTLQLEERCFLQQYAFN